jgi:hypothetical protein
VAAGWIVGYPLIAGPSFFRETFRAIELPAHHYLRALWPATSSTLVMAIAVLLVRSFIIPAGSLPDAARLVVLVAAGVVAYAAMGLGLFRGRVDQFLAVWRGRTAPPGGDLTVG